MAVLEVRSDLEMEVLVNATRILLSQIVVLLALLDSAGAGESAPTDPNKPKRESVSRTCNAITTTGAETPGLMLRQWPCG